MQRRRGQSADCHLLCKGVKKRFTTRHHSILYGVLHTSSYKMALLLTASRKSSSSLGSISGGILTHSRLPLVLRVGDEQGRGSGNGLAS